MKRTISLLLLIFVSNCIFAQTQVTYVKTPRGGDVTDAWELGHGMDSTQMAALSDSITLNFPNATEVNPPSATAHYNCHSFAWYRSEGGTGNVWIGWDPGITGEDIYWGDGSYVEVSTLDYASKISYAGDHSAIKLSGTNCRSKWGAWPLVDHPVGYGPLPYNMSVRKYYKLSNPTISSNSYAPLCNNVQRTFSESAFTDIDLDYDWGYSSPLAEVSDDDNPTYTVEGTSQNGQGIVSLTVTTPSGATATASKTVWVGKPDPDQLDFIRYMSSDNPYTLTEYDDWNNNNLVLIDGMALMETDQYLWDMDFTYSNISPNGELIAVLDVYDINSTGYTNISIKAHNTCGWSDDFSMGIEFEILSGGYYMVFSPNPVVGETTLSIESTSTEKTFDENTSWELEVYSQTQLLKEKKTKLRGKSTQIQTNGWKEGVYMVRVKYSREGKPGEVLQGKLVVKK